MRRRVTDERIVVAGTTEHFDAVEGIACGKTGVSTGLEIQADRAAAGVLIGHRVIACTTNEVVTTCAAIQQVVTVAARDDVVAGVAVADEVAGAGVGQVFDMS